MFAIALGAFVKDVVTGFEGVVTTRSEHITGCNTYWVNPEVDKKTGLIREGYWFDENRLLVKKGKKLLKIPENDFEAINQFVRPTRPLFPETGKKGAIQVKAPHDKA